MERKHLITIIIGLMTASLILIISMQTHILVRSYKSKKELVDRGINEALSLAVKKMEKQDALMFIYDKMLDEEQENIDSIYPIDPYMFQGGMNPNNAQIFENNFEISITSTIGGATHIFTFKDIAGNPFGYNPIYNLKNIEQYFEKQINDTSMNFSDMIEQLEREYRIRSYPIEERFDSQTIESILKTSLMQKGILIDFEFSVANGKQEICIQSAKFNHDMLAESYHINMAPSNLFDNPDELHVFFNDKEKYVLKGIYAQLAGSILFTLIILITFSVTLYTVFKQKKMSEIKNDFINNMTHEFKTPIATIRLASDSMKNPKVNSNPDAVVSFAEIITQETQRMNHHVEQVLQMALLEKQGVKIKSKPEDMHDIIEDSLNSIELIIEERNGKVNSKFKANMSIVSVDRDSMLTVLNNLFDNANKYSPEKLEIDIYTYNKNNQFVFEVHDKGLGMNKDVQSHVFDRFYRANTGNVHNIKGFGLGLNYVKEIIEAHNGQIKVISQLGKGSTFIVYLPLKKISQYVKRTC